MQNVKQIQKIYNMSTFFFIDIMTSSNFGLKIAKTQKCRRKLKLVSNDAEFKADSENI